MIRMSKQHANLNFEGVRSEILPNYRYEHFERGITLYEKMHLNYQSCVSCGSRRITSGFDGYPIRITSEFVDSSNFDIWRGLLNHYLYKNANVEK